MTDATARLAESRIVAIFRGEGDAEYLLDAASVLNEAGMRTIEITFDTPGASTILTRLRDGFGNDLLIGAGTITTTTDADRAKDAGADFLVSPYLDPAVLAHAQRSSVPFYPGVLTPSEIHVASQLGCRTVKIFPASLGGPGYLKTLAGPIADMRFLPTGGIGLRDVVPYLKAGALAVGLGSALTGRTRSLEEFTARVHTVQTHLTEAAHA